VNLRPSRRLSGGGQVGNLPHFGRIFFALCMVAFGVQNIFYTGFVKGLELTPEWVPAHTFWAYLDGVLLFVGGIGIAIRVKARLGAVLVAAVYFASVVFLRIPRIGLTVHDIGERTVLFEPLTIGCGALFLAGMFLPAARILFGISMIVFGIDHFQVLSFIATLIPAWIPGRLFWSAFTGAAFIAAGLSIVTRWQMRVASFLLGLMFFLWVLVVHAPRIAASPHNGNEWNSGLVALAICGAAWILTE
jgi:uncharacterized membrane protein YphA (DoxX/SURF4 family)